MLSSHLSSKSVLSFVGFTLLFSFAQPVFFGKHIIFSFVFDSKNVKTNKVNLTCMMLALQFKRSVPFFSALVSK